MTSKGKSAVSAAAKATTGKPKVVALEESEVISLKVLNASIEQLEERLKPLLESRKKILAKIEIRAGLEPETLAKEYQLANGELVKIGQ